MSLLYKDKTGTIQDISGGSITTEDLINLKAELQEYIKNETTLSAPVTYTARKSFTAAYDGLLYAASNTYTSQFDVVVYRNGARISPPSYPVGEFASATFIIEVKKGDVISITSPQQSAVVFAGWVQYYENRDYSDRS